jgi:4-hydroxy-2-oxoglutarate aldolase
MIPLMSHVDRITGAPPPGVWVPALVFFTPDESIDYDATAAHLLRLARGGLTGLLIHGSNGEAMHLSREERAELIGFARRTLDAAGLNQTPLMAGTGAESLRETGQLCRDAAAAGAQWALVLPPAYWRAAMGAERLREWYADVERVSPLPVLVYNFPAVRAGIDVDADLLGELARAAPGRIVGTKISDANVGKLNRLGTELNEQAGGPPFRAFAGRSDIFLNAVVGGAAGVIGALVNFAPATHMRLWKLIQSGQALSHEARCIQSLLARADGEMTKLGGVSGIKTAVSYHFGYGRQDIEGTGEQGAMVRKPLKSLPFSAVQKEPLNEVFTQLKTVEDGVMQDGVDAPCLLAVSTQPWTAWAT